MQIFKNETRTAFKGPAEWFTGAVRVEMLFSPTDPARTSAGNVTFEPAARTAWHIHPLGQMLIVTAGRGFIQKWGEAPQAIGPGDVVWIAPNEKHWHGAAPTSALTHIAIQESLDGSAVAWLEQVSDVQYLNEAHALPHEQSTMNNTQ